MAERTVLCRYCHVNYSLGQILGIAGPIGQLRSLQPDGLVPGDLAELKEDLENAGIEITRWDSVELPRRKGALARFFSSKPERSEADVANLLAKKWDPYCPKLHFMLDALTDHPFFITVAGDHGASKSTFLLGMTNDLLQNSTLGPFDHLDPKLRPSQLDEVRQSIELVFAQKQDLAGTSPTEIQDSFVIRLSDRNESEPLDVGFVDVAGEVIRNIQETAKRAKFVYSSQAIILLLDPQSFPKADSYLEAVGPNVRVANPDIINHLSEGIEAVRGRRAKELGIPLIVAVAKSDMVDWQDKALVADGSTVEARNPDFSDLSAADALHRLEDESGLVRAYLLDHHMMSIVRTAESQFGVENVAYTRFSSYGDPNLVTRKPEGCWKPLALILKKSGYLREPSGD